MTCAALYGAAPLGGVGVMVPYRIPSRFPPAGAAVNDRLSGTSPDHGPNPAASVQVVPAPWPGGAAVSLPPEPEPILAALLGRPRLPQAAQHEAPLEESVRRPPRRDPLSQGEC